MGPVPKRIIGAGIVGVNRVAVQVGAGWRTASARLDLRKGLPPFLIRDFRDLCGCICDPYCMAQAVEFAAQNLAPQIGIQ